MKLTVEVDFEEGDIFIFNDEEWKIKDIDNHTAEITMRKVGIEKSTIMTVDDIERDMRFTGKFSRIRASYLND